MAFVVLSVLLAGTMWVVPYLPTNDGPEWVFAAHVENHYGDPGTIYQDVFVPAPQFASRGFMLLFAPFDAWLGWQRGLQVGLTLAVLLFAWGFVTLVRGLDPARWPVAFLGFPLALSWGLYAGFWSFVVSIGLGLFVLALVVRLPELTWKGRALLSLLLFLVAVAHVFGAVLTGSVVLALLLARAPRERRLGELARTVVMGLPAIGILALCVVVTRDLPAVAFARDVERFAWRDALAILPRTIAPGPLARALVVTLGAACAGVFAVVRARRSDTSASDRGLGIAAGLLLLAGVLAPFQFLGWQAFSQRFVPLGVALAVAVLPLERCSIGLRKGLGVGLFVTATVWLGLTYPFHRRLTELCPDAIAGLLAPISLSGTLLPVAIRPTELPAYDRFASEVPLVAPLTHMGPLYAAAHGGVSARSFAGNPSVHPFVLRPSTFVRPWPDQEQYATTLSSYRYHQDLPFREEVDGELASFGMYYDEIALFGALPEDIAVWQARGYVADWQRGSVLLAHFVPCALDVTLPATTTPPGPEIDLRVGKITLVEAARVKPEVGDDGRLHFQLAPSPCGIVNVRVRWEPTPEGRRRACRNANPAGDLVVAVSRTSHSIACDLVEP